MCIRDRGIAWWAPLFWLLIIAAIVGGVKIADWDRNRKLPPGAPKLPGRGLKTLLIVVISMVGIFILGFVLSAIGA